MQLTRHSAWRDSSDLSSSPAMATFPYPLPSLIFLLILLVSRPSTVHASPALFASIRATNDSPSSLEQNGQHPAHCECRCCTRSHFRTSCPDTPLSVPLDERHSCDTRLASRNDPLVCGTALCHANFPGQCEQPAFFQHTCVFDGGPLHQWAPFAFVFLALLALLYGVSSIFTRADSLRTDYLFGHKRPPIPSTADPSLSQPLVSATDSLRDAYDFDFVDVSPRRSPASLKRASSSPIRNPSSQPSTASLLQRYNSPSALRSTVSFPRDPATTPLLAHRENFALPAPARSPSPLSRFSSRIEDT